jgi:hypothetical protein
MNIQEGSVINEKVMSLLEPVAEVIVSTFKFTGAFKDETCF